MNGTRKAFFFGVIILLLLGFKTTAAGVVVSDKYSISSAEKEAYASFSEGKGLKQAPATVLFAETNELSIPSREGNFHFQKFSNNSISACLNLKKIDTELRSYILHSRNIEPGLGIRKIIFPFHLFW